MMLLLSLAPIWHLKALNFSSMAFQSFTGSTLCIRARSFSTSFFPGSFIRLAANACGIPCPGPYYSGHIVMRSHLSLKFSRAQRGGAKGAAWGTVDHEFDVDAVVGKIH